MFFIKDNTISRIEYIDVFKAFEIILMIMGHIGFGSIFDKIIHGSHMPMFFFVSGLLYSLKYRVGTVEKCAAVHGGSLDCGCPFEVVSGYLARFRSQNPDLRNYSKWD